AADESVRTIVVTGAGRGFCAGADMDALRGLGKGSTWSGSGRLTTHALSIPKPIIAAVNGACPALGFVHALMCDLRFAAAGAKFTTAFVRRGLIAEHGSSWLPPRLIDPPRALDNPLYGPVRRGAAARPREPRRARRRAHGGDAGLRARPRDELLPRGDGDDQVADLSP